MNTSVTPSGPSLPLDAGLTRKQKAQLHEVADLLLEIYQTLARMRRIKAAWIQPGPHDLSAHLPFYASIGLDPRIIYLYSIMPCLEPIPALASSACFYKSCRFFDPRQEAHVREARELYHDYAESGDDPGHELRPWMTALSRIGHRYAMVVIYDAQRHVVFVGDNWSLENEDPNFYLDDLRARPAGDVLRDIILWYRELVDVPGCSADDEDWCGHDDALRAVYRKHGWPGENFDGDAFVVDRARVVPAAEVRFEPEEALPERLEYLQYMVRESEEAEKAATSQGHQKLAAAKTIDEEWVARWEMWNAEQHACQWKNRLMRANELVVQGRQRQNVDDLPLWEWDKVRRDFEYQQLSIGWQKQRLEAAEISTLPLSQEYIRCAEEQIATLQKACAASQADAERLCPGRSISSLDPDESVKGLKKQMKLEYLAGNLRHLEQGIVDTREWIAQLPEGTGEARKLAQTVINDMMKQTEQLRQEANRG